jgi:molybdopterin-binding protein
VKIHGIEGMSTHELDLEIRRGGKFVVFLYTISVLIMTFRRGSEVYFVKADESAVGKGLGYTLLTLLAGWWGIPWGPIYTIGSVFTNLSGSKDVTSEVVNVLAHAGGSPS